MWKDFFVKNNSVIYLLGLIFLFQVLMSWGVPALSDEVPHFAQIKELATKSNPRISPFITTPVYFHTLFSVGLEALNSLGIAQSFLTQGYIESKNLFDIFAVRLSIVILVFVLLLYCSLIISKTTLVNKNIIFLSLVTIPIIFPFIPLIYTDIVAVSFILLAFVSGMHNSMYISAASILLATMVRQPSISWIVPLMLLIYYKEKDFKKIIPHLCVLVCFGLFTLENSGIALGDKGSHTLGLHLQNMWFFGFIFFCITIGYFHTTITEGIKKYTREHRGITVHVLTILTLLLVFTIYYQTYHITHRYNEPRYGWFLRNKILIFTTTITWVKILFGIMSVSGLYMFIKTTYSNIHIYSEYAFKAIALLSISMMPLVEQRYYIPIFVLTAFYISTSDREFKIDRVATIQTLCNILLGIYFFVSIMHAQFFL